jgi:hypothetical protein
MAANSWHNWLTKAMTRGRTRSRKRAYLRPRLEALEDRTLPATSITVIQGAFGSGSQDTAFKNNGGQLLFNAPNTGSGATLNTLSTGALASIAAGHNIVVDAAGPIEFKALSSPLNLQTGQGDSVTFSTNHTGGGNIFFDNTSNTLTTAGGNSIFDAGAALTAANLNSNGGDVSLTASEISSGALGAKGILTAGAGNITLTDNNGAITQSGIDSGQAISVTASGNVLVDSLRGTTVGLTSNNGSVGSLGANPVQASSELIVSAATGINLDTRVNALEASNSSSGAITITQLASPAQTLNIVGTGVVNSASGGTVNLTNKGASIAVSSGVNVASTNGAITLAATDFQLNGAIDSGTGATNLENSIAGRQIDVGTNTLGKIGLTNAELATVTAGTLRIGSSTAGNITVSQAITNPATWNTLSLITGASVTEAAAGSLTVPNLRVTATSQATLLSTNNVGTLAGNTGGTFSFDNGTNLLTVGTVDNDIGIVTNNSNITLIADTMSIGESVTTGSSSVGTVTLLPSDLTRTIDLGAGNTGGLELTNGDLNEITAGVLQIGSSDFTGPITVSAAINPLNIGALSLITTASGTITQGTGDTITVANGSGGLAIQADTAVSLNELNNVGKLAAAISGSGNGFSFTDTAGYAVSTVAGVTGITTDTGHGETVTLAAGGAVTQDTGASIVTDKLLLLDNTNGGASFALNDTGNDVGTLAASVTNSVSYTDSDDLVIGTVGTTNGITTTSNTNGSVSVNTVVGDLTVSQNIGAGTSVSLTAGSSLGSPDHILTNNAAITGTSATLTADRMALDNGTINVGTGSSNTVTLKNFSSGRTIDLGGTGDPTGTLQISNAEVNTITANRLFIGSATAGNLSVTAQIAPTLTSFLSLITGAGILDSNLTEPDVTVTSLTLQAGAGISLNLGVSKVQAQTTTGNITLTNNQALTIGGLDASLGGIQVTGSSGSISLNNTNGSVFIQTQGEVVSAPGNITITATGASSDLQTGGQTTADAIQSTGTGNIQLTAGRNVLLGDSNGTGSVVAHNGFLTIGAVGNVTVDYGSQVTIQSGSDSLTVNSSSGSILIQNTSSVNGAAIQNLGSGKISLNTGAGGAFTLNSGTGGEVESNGGAINISADAMTISDPIDASNDGTAATTGIVTLTPVTASETIDVGGTATNGAGILGISDAELSEITASAVRIGSSSQTGPITVFGNVTTHAGYNTLDLIAGGTGGSITESTGTVAVANLALQAANGIGSAGAIQVSGPINVAFDNTTSGAVQITSTGGGMTIGSVDGVTTSSNNAANASTGATTLIATGPLTFAVNTTSTGTLSGQTNETASETVSTPEDNLTVNNGVTVKSTGGDVDLTAADSLNVASGGTVTSNTGAVNLTAGSGDTDSDASLTMDGTVNAAADSGLSSSGNITLGVINDAGHTVTLTSTNGAIINGTHPVGGNITATTVNLNAATGIGAATPITINASTLSFANSTSNSVQVSNLTGDLSASGSNSASGGAINLSEVAGHTLTVNSGNISSSNGPITLSADSLALTGTVNAGTGSVTLRQAGTTARGIEVGGSTLSNVLDITNTMLGQITAGTLRIGRADNTGNLMVTAAVPTESGFSTLDLISGGTISQGVNDTVTVANGNGGLALQGAAGVTMNQTNNVGTVAGTTTNKTFTFDNQGTTTVGTVDGVTGINAGTGNVNLTVGVPNTTTGILLSGAPNSNSAIVTGGTVTLTALGPSNGATGQIGAPALFFGVSAAILNASTDNSRLWISAINGTTVGTVDAGTDTAILKAVNGNLSSSHSATPTVPDVTANTVILVSSTGGSFGSAISPLLVQTSNLNASTTGSGSINVTNVSAGSDLTVTGASAANGDINLKAVNGNLTVAGGDTVSSTGGNVTLSAGKGLNLQSGATVTSSTSSGKTVSLAAGLSNNGSSSTIAGKVDGSAVNVTSGTGADSLFVDFTNGASLPHGLHFTKNGSDSLTLSDSGSATARTYAITGTSVSRPSTGPITFTAGTPVTLDGGTGADVFNVGVNSTSNYNLTIHDGDNAASTLNVTVSGTPSKYTKHNTGTDAAILDLLFSGGLESKITYTGIHIFHSNRTPTNI